MLKVARGRLEQFGGLATSKIVDLSFVNPNTAFQCIQFGGWCYLSARLVASHGIVQNPARPIAGLRDIAIVVKNLGALRRATCLFSLG